MERVRFNIPPVVGSEVRYIQDAITRGLLAGDNFYSRKCHGWFENHLRCKKAFLTTSCTHALEIAALLIGIEPGDEVIMPSYTFVSTANAFVLRGAKIIFVDIRPETMNIDERLIEAAITKHTKAIVPVHYAGVACEMDVIMDIAKRHKLFVIEDSAQGMMATYKGKPLGTIGNIGTYSFHETKNYTSAGEGGLLIINDDEFIERAEIIREKGTNRSLFFRGMVDKYSWVDVGSSYLPNDLSAAYLWGQLELAEKINSDRLISWKKYIELLKPLDESDKIELPVIPDSVCHNGHMLYFKVKDFTERTALLDLLNKNGVAAVFHYIPLHSSKAGKIFSIFSGDDKFTTEGSERLIRLPMYYGLETDKLNYIVNLIYQFFGK